VVVGCPLPVRTYVRSRLGCRCSAVSLPACLPTNHSLDDWMIDIHHHHRSINHINIDAICCHGMNTSSLPPPHYLYHLLDVPIHATKLDIATAFRRAAKLTHPDQQQQQYNTVLIDTLSTFATSMLNHDFLAIHHAYTVLINEETRVEYDQQQRALIDDATRDNRSILWQHLNIDELDVQDEPPCLVYHCRCGHDICIDRAELVDLKEPLKIACLGCSLGIEIRNDP